MFRNWNPLSIGRSATAQQQATPGTFDTRRRLRAGLPSRQLKELKQLQNENTRLKKRVTELKLDKSILQNLARLGSAGKCP
jgi:cell division protein FtsB